LATRKDARGRERLPIVDLSTDALLTTTRSVRKRLDLTKPVPVGLIRECLEIAVQAPTSANVQNWSFVVVTDAEQRRAIADVYRRTWDLIVASPFAVADRFKDDPARNREQRKVSDSAAYLAEHIGEVPVLMIPCVEVIDGDGTLTGENANQYWSSIMPRPSPTAYYTGTTFRRAERIPLDDVVHFDRW
jgi:nitroreductase